MPWGHVGGQWLQEPFPPSVCLACPAGSPSLCKLDSNPAQRQVMESFFCFLLFGDFCPTVCPFVSGGKRFLLSTSCCGVSFNKLFIFW